MDSELKEYLEQQFKSIRSEMATKEDLTKMATKDDIKNMATKDDIKAIRAEVAETKEELKRHMGVLYENMQHKLDVVIEGFQANLEADERLKKDIHDTDKKVEGVEFEFRAHKMDTRIHRSAA